MGQVDGKIAVVTGGASGIGAACAETLAREGAMVKSQARSISRIMTCGKTCHRMAFYVCSQQFLTGPCYSTAPLANAPPWPCRQRRTPELAQLDTSRAGSRPGERRAAHLLRYPRHPSLNDRNGHEDQFPLPRLRVRYVLAKANFDETRLNG